MSKVPCCCRPMQATEVAHTHAGSTHNIGFQPGPTTPQQPVNTVQNTPTAMQRCHQTLEVFLLPVYMSIELYSLVQYLLHKASRAVAYCKLSLQCFTDPPKAPHKLVCKLAACSLFTKLLSNFEGNFLSDTQTKVKLLYLL